MRILNRIAADGGYVWAEYHGVTAATLGYVQAGSEVEFVESTWERYEKNFGRRAILKSLRLRKVRKVGKHELLNLRACRPRQGTIARWHVAQDRVRAFVERETIQFAWEQLSPSEQEIVCVEFLRDSSVNGLPRLDRLLLPPGRTLADIDIYATTRRSRRKIIAQVTFHNAANAHFR